MSLAPAVLDVLFSCLSAATTSQNEFYHFHGLYHNLPIPTNLRSILINTNSRSSYSV